MRGFIAQLVEHRTGIAEVTGSNPVETLIFSGFFFPSKDKNERKKFNTTFRWLHVIIVKWKENKKFHSLI